MNTRNITKEKIIVYSYIGTIKNIYPCTNAYNWISNIMIAKIFKDVMFNIKIINIPKT